MTTYYLRTDDGREWTLPAGNPRSVRIAAYNILFRERIPMGVVWAKRAQRKNGEVARWIISRERAKFAPMSPGDLDPSGWRNLAHEITYFDDEDGFVIDRELYDEQSIEDILSYFDLSEVDVDSRRLMWLRYSIELYDPDDCVERWQICETKTPGSFPVWVFDRRGAA